MLLENNITLEIFKLEKDINKPEVRKSLKELESLLSDEFIEFGSSGKIYTKQQVIEALHNEIPLYLSIENFKTIEITDGVVLATYTAASRSINDNTEKYSLRSSIWNMIDGRWQLLFHQGTPLTKKS